MVRWAVIPCCAAMRLCFVSIGLGLLLPLLAVADNPLPSGATSSRFQDLFPSGAQAKVQYRIGRQSLAGALTFYAEQSNLQILFRTQGVPAVEVGPLEGAYEPREAIAILLEKTGLDYSFGKGRVIVINPSEENKIEMSAVATKNN